MEHEAFVPFPLETVRLALGEPDRVARCVSGLQLDVDPPAGSAGTLTGRLRLRIGNSTITYRGNVRIAECDGGFEIEGEGVEARGSGTVKAALVIGVEPAEDGTRLGFSGAVQAEGRLTEYDADTVDAAGRRLLDRFVADLVTDLEAEPPAVPSAAAEQPSVTLPEETVDEADDTLLPGEEEGLDVVEFEVPGIEVPENVAGLEEGTGLGAQAHSAEAAHARRTMIGRSAEEVDHAPPRGRYAPVPAPPATSATATLRWAAPAAAALVASAVVVGRVLRRRR
ncbi:MULTISPECIES: SRPBCC domain-containing protein [Streptomycetaceae]|uniref:Carbon monoxide dehydrogenase subunit G n=1 Tax=Streptantibioticus cattleyicolor (strain ATCC 35852 / DSM 46488 / JCM 4925 / NBRC 14057 / NRRL 8057) TaxID=1003195 RepID=F8JVI5_STREN|nr:MULTISPECIES: SRPBCC domain-containing protein [Streptomycetaceae]AEW95684.1 hypothetical protein SCATT_33130 [Streptantibioticus cattleyicolor NRRL 8057 = DSM 46488]MYS60230.1 carbon monoxide dehydrogenase subunit G [Streptomyces sp. SID5468]CCB76022.1 conserved protein of unknown function [Streptantibioticus cattleyicolor NRRL 8057 = DSM 46488]